MLVFCKHCNRCQLSIAKVMSGRKLKKRRKGRNISKQQKSIHFYTCGKQCYFSTHKSIKLKHDLLFSPVIQ